MPALLDQPCPTCAQHEQPLVADAAHRFDPFEDTGPPHWLIAFGCPRCGARPDAVIAADADAPPPPEVNGSLEDAGHEAVGWMIDPARPDGESEGHWKAARAALDDGDWHGAGMAFRDLLQSAIHAADPDPLQLKLPQRVNRLAKAGMIGAELQGFAHTVRGLGMGRFDPREPFTEDQARQMAAFSGLLLLELFGPAPADGDAAAD